MKIKVWGFYAGSPSRRILVAASSQKAAVEQLHQAGMRDITVGFLRQYAALTGNRDELATATEPGVWRYLDESRRAGIERLEAR